MRRAPPIPPDIRRFRHDGYTNAFSFVSPECPRFYPTETLFGDWRAPFLILAKDAAPTHVMRGLVEREGCDGWRHAQRERRDPAGYRTNERLVDLVRSHALPEPLYGSATAHMLYDDPRWSRSLPGFYSGALHEHLADVLRWVIGESSVRVIACVGIEAWFLTSVVLGYRWPSRSAAARSARDHRDKALIISGMVGKRELCATCHFHPSRGGPQQWNLGWSGLASLIDRSSKPVPAHRRTGAID
jgi:hypothetical protein